MGRRLAACLIIIGMALGGCSSTTRSRATAPTTSASRGSAPDAQTVAAELCSLPTNAQQTVVLGSVDPTGGMPRFDGRLPDCTFVGNQGELIIEVDRGVTQAALQQHISDISSGAHCARFSPASEGDESFRCAGHAPAGLDHRPELLAVTFRGQTVGGAIWLGNGEGQALPSDEGAKLAALHALCTEIVKRYASP